MDPVSPEGRPISRAKGEVPVRVLTEYRGTFAKNGDRDDLVALQRVTAPAEDESEEHPAGPRQTRSYATLRQLESQCVRQVQHHRVLKEEHEKEIAKVAAEQADERHRG